MKINEKNDIDEQTILDKINSDNHFNPFIEFSNSDKNDHFDFDDDIEGLTESYQCVSPLPWSRVK